MSRLPLRALNVEVVDVSERTHFGKLRRTLDRLMHEEKELDVIVSG